MTNTNPIADEQRIEQLEASFPAASGKVFSKAYESAVAAGLKVMISENGQIFEVSGNGERRLIKTVTPPDPAEPGQKYTIQ